MPDLNKIAKDLENNFRRDFQKLLEKYGADAGIVDEWGEMPFAQITMKSTWDDNNDQITPFTQFTLF